MDMGNGHLECYRNDDIDSVGMKIKYTTDNNEISPQNSPVPPPPAHPHPSAITIAATAKLAALSKNARKKAKKKAKHKEEMALAAAAAAADSDGTDGGNNDEPRSLDTSTSGDVHDNVEDDIYARIGLFRSKKGLNSPVVDTDGLQEPDD